MCLDCSLTEVVSISERFCLHWTPEHWEAKGFKRHWGDAAVSNWPQFEILRRESSDIVAITFKPDTVEYVILAPYQLRRPLIIYATSDANFHLTSWGSY